MAENPSKMLVNRLFALLLLAVFVAAWSCKNKLPEKKYPSEKLAPNDPFKETMVESRFYEIKGNEDNVVEGAEGTTLVIPEGSLMHKDGSMPKGKIKVELAEALDMADMVLSNLTTTSDGKQLQSGGMIYLNATADGEELRINPEKPIRIEIPTDKKVPGMMVYRGIRDSAGNMNWVDPLPLINYLVPVDLSLLDFLPGGFYDTVVTNMPYRGHVTADRKLADSLYYSLAVNDGTHLTSSQSGTDMNEAHYNPDKKIIDGKYTDESYDIKLNGSGLN
ncbi:MAG TPA: hypothetical protein VEC12_12400, partial [Bacteroidia bacterium]|nr:hypothetical protein [Bacteroidia bacterium]